MNLPDELVNEIRTEGGRFVLAYSDDRDEWMAGCEWGKEADDSDMAGAAAYGLGKTADEAVGTMLGDMGIGA